MLNCTSSVGCVQLWGCTTMSTTTSHTSDNLISTFNFPFSDKRWFLKLLIGVLLSLAGMLIPIIPSIFLVGYYYRISRRIIAEDGQPALPEWDEWGRLFIDGIKYLGGVVIYSLPLILSMLVFYLLMFLPCLSMFGASDTWHGYGADPRMMTSMLLLLLAYPMMGLSLLISLLTGIVLPPALMHLVAHNSFGAAFQVSSWWKIVRANIGGFLIAFLLSISLLTVVYFGIY